MKTKKPQKRIFSTFDKITQASVGKYLDDIINEDETLFLFLVPNPDNLRCDAGNYYIANKFPKNDVHTKNQAFKIAKYSKSLLRNHIKYRKIRIFEDGSVFDQYANLRKNIFEFIDQEIIYREDLGEFEVGLIEFCNKNAEFFDEAPPSLNDIVNHVQATKKTVYIKCWDLPEFRITNLFT